MRQLVVKFSKWNINNWNLSITIDVIIYFSWQEKWCIVCYRAREVTETQLKRIKSTSQNAVMLHTLSTF